MIEGKFTMYACPECAYKSLQSGNCRSHPYPLRGMGPPMVAVEVMPVAECADVIVTVAEEFEKAAKEGR